MNDGRCPKVRRLMLPCWIPACAGMTSYRGFTVIELLVVISIISLLMAILLPALNIAKSQARQVVCKNNLRQFVIANQNYANEHNNYSVPGALDIHLENLHRWYGVRKSKNEPFDPAAGPLASYLSDKELTCPQKIDYVSLLPDCGDYECGNGGFGYNFVYVGSKVWQKGYDRNESYKESTRLTEISRPYETLLFADTAIFKQVDGQPSLIRYAFAEPRFLVINQVPDPTWTPYPSIHFRHRKQANIAWADGHVDHRKAGPYDGRNSDGTNPSDYCIGWFEPMDNSLFDLK